MEKIFISADRMEQDSWNFAVDLYNQGEEFDVVVGVARGGAQIAIYMQEALSVLYGKPVAYLTVQAHSYTGIGEAESRIEILYADKACSIVKPGWKILVADDVFDRGVTLKAVSDNLQELLGDTCSVSIASLYFKPENNLTDIIPHFHFREYKGDDWLVFPHELCDLTQEELIQKGFPLNRVQKT